ncbi:MAG: RNA-binding S4 domain-containing protein [Bacteroidales bacterium]|jgi:23S rRNA pseudouridine2605 synthase|nr:RNA-binding S4 domain-containing protein [Bacteroidales bacterium]MBQ3991029.1 RNA-binding S4 domain-containing protein [Bacteroidales bacterium]
MRTFDDDETRGPRNSRDRRDNNKPKFNRNRDDRNSAPRERRNFDRDDDFKPRNNNKFNRDRKPRSFDEDMRNPDNRNFSGKKKDKASKYYDAPEYQKKHHDGHHGGKPAGKPERFRTKNYKDYDNFDEFDDNNYQERRIRRSEKPKPAKKDNDEVRLNKYIANSGICSRREADTYIQAGVVTINGEVVTELGTKVKPGDEVRFGGELINPEKLVYILLNKPKNCVTTLDDPEERQTVMDLVKDACPERIYPVGRLDRNTTGLLLLTNDGDLTKKLTHPSYEKKKIYQVETDKNISKADLQALADGFELEDGFIAADAVSYVGDSKNIIGIEIHSGRNRIVRRMLEHLGYEVKRLDRVYFAGLTKLNLPRGKWRFLTEKEITILKTGMYE